MERIPVRKVMVIYNPRAGTLLAAGDDDPETNLRKLFEDRGIEPELHAFDFKKLPEWIVGVEEKSIDAVIACGGDGSILAVVAALGRSRLPLGIIPAGTMNVLARDLGLPMEAGAAVDVILGGSIEAIDVGFVNGQPFLCNSAIGLMPHLARTREKLREVPWWRRWPRVITQSFTLMRTYPRLRVTLEMEGQTRHFRTRAIAVSNNPLSDTPGPIPARKTLNSGKLGIYIARDTSRWALLRIAARMMAGTWQNDESLEMVSAQSATLSLDRVRPLSVMNDGEPSQLETPLNYVIEERVLRVLVPERNPG